MVNRKKWSTEELEILRSNMNVSIAVLSSLIPTRTQAAIRIKLLSETKIQKSNSKDAKPKETPIGGDNIREGKFNPSKHRILNSDITGKIPIWIASERMFVYTDDENKKPGILAKWANRHKF